MPLYRPCSCGVFAPGQDHAVFNMNNGGTATFNSCTLFFYTTNSVLSGPSLAGTFGGGSEGWSIALRASNFAMFWSGFAISVLGSVRYSYVPRTVQSVTIIGTNVTKTYSNVGMHAVGNTEYGVFFGTTNAPATTDGTWNRVQYSTNTSVTGSGAGFNVSGAGISATGAYALMLGGVATGSPGGLLTSTAQLLYASLTTVARPTVLSVAKGGQLAQCNGIIAIVAGGVIETGGASYGLTASADQVLIATEANSAATALTFGLSYRITEAQKIGQCSNTGQAVFNTGLSAGWGGAFASYDYNLNTWVSYFAGYSFAGAGA